MGKGGGGDTTVHYQADPVSQEMVNLFRRYVAPRIEALPYPNLHFITNENISNTDRLAGEYNYYFNHYVPASLNTDRSIIENTFTDKANTINQFKNIVNQLPTKVEQSYNEAINTAKQVFEDTHNRSMLGLSASGFVNTNLAQREASKALNATLLPMLNQKANALSEAHSLTTKLLGDTTQLDLTNISNKAQGLLGVNTAFRENEGAKLQAKEALNKAWLQAQLLPDMMFKDYIGMLSGARAGFTPIVEERQSLAGTLGRGIGAGVGTYATLAAVGVANPIAIPLAIGAGLLGGKR